MAASVNATVVVGSVSGGTTKPRVNGDDPLVWNAARQVWTPSARNMPVYPTMTRTSQVAGSTSRASGA
jgi:hypothetical protein